MTRLCGWAVLFASLVTFGCGSDSDSAGSTGNAGSGGASGKGGSGGGAGSGASSGVGGTSGAGASAGAGATAGSAGAGGSVLGRLAGVNLAGAEFGDANLPGEYGKDYIYPNQDEVDYFVGKGMNLIRLPFRWERLQPQANGAFDATELGRMHDFVDPTTGKGASVLLDPHNYARYYGGVIGDAVPSSAFADFWQRLAEEFKSNPKVIFGLVNEPHDMSTDVWKNAANEAIAAIRSTGANNPIFVPGNAWTGAWTWEQDSYGTPNAVAMLEISDPANNVVFEVHQYLDTDGSGTSQSCVSATIGSERLQVFSAWLETNGKRGFLGEIGVGQNDTCYVALAGALDLLDTKPELWVGWAYWAAGPWWGNYGYSIEPQSGVDAPQMAVLSKYLPP